MSDVSKEVTFEEDDHRLKVVLFLGMNWPIFILHSFSLVVWIGMLAAVLAYLLRGLSSSFVLTVILILWILIWVWFGRFLWTRWQFNAANREVLFVEPEQLIIRRPVSILGLTWVYDINHIEGLYYSEQHRCPAFDYAYQHVYFGRSLAEDQAKSLVEELNRRYFPAKPEDEIVY